MPVSKSTYTPGMCNIGPAERRMRRMSGIAAAVVTIALVAVLSIINAPWGVKLLVFIPAAISASGFLQDAFHFCAAFGLRGIYNVVNSTGVTENIELESYRKQDRRKALQIIGLSGLIGVAITLIALFI